MVWIPSSPWVTVQKLFAKKAGITYSTLIEIESETNDNPIIKTLMKIADGLNVSIDSMISKKR